MFPAFDLAKHNTTLRNEIMAGLTSFITVSYIIVVNASILAQAGMPFEAVMLATVLTSAAGCWIMALRANSPLILIPGMGDNSFFAFTLVLSLGLPWRQAITAVLAAGIVFALVSLAPQAIRWIRTIPASLIHAMTAGIGLFLAFLGLHKGQLLQASPTTLVALGSLSDPHALTTLMTLAILLILFIRQWKGSFLIAIAAGTAIGSMFGIVDFRQVSGFQLSFSGYGAVFGAYDFSGMRSLDFWMATFSLSVMVIFQNMGAQLGMLPDPAKFKRSYQANAFSIMAASLLGSSSTVSAAESITGIAAGGRTGLTSLTAGLLFLPAIFVIPILKVIPDSAIAPILILVGGLMFLKVKEITFERLPEGLAAFILIAAIPFTFSISSGIAFGFISYTLLKWAAGQRKEIPAAMYALSAICLIYFVLDTLI